MLVSGQNAVRAYRKAWPIVPGLHDAVRPLRQVRALEHWEKDLQLALDAHAGYLDCGASSLVDGDMEAVGVGAWLAWGAGLAKNLIAPYEGLRWMQITGGGGVASCGQVGALGAVGNTVRVRGAMQWVGGVSAPQVLDGAGNIRWAGVIGAGWQLVDTGPFVVVNSDLHLGNWASGVGDVWGADAMTVTPLNITTWNDRTRRGGRSPTQAVVASRPVQTVADQPSNRNSVVFDGVNDLLKTPPFTLNQPSRYCWLAKWIWGIGQTDLQDGNGLNSQVCYATGTVVERIYAGVSLAGGNAVDGAWRTHDLLFNGLSSYQQSNGETQIIGNSGASNAGGFTLCAGATGVGNWAHVHVGQVIVSSRTWTPNEEINLSRSMMRHACI